MPDPLPAVQLLTAEHAVDSFDCGKVELTEWLQRFALDNQRNGSARVWVVCRGQRVVGYYALAAASVVRDEAPPRIGRGLAAHDIPVILLARLAINEDEQGQGLGSALLKDALVRTAGAAEEFGVRALLVHAQD